MIYWVKVNSSEYTVWQDIEASDKYEALRFFAEEQDDEGLLSSGETLAVLVRSAVDNTTMHELFAELSVHYDSREIG